MPTDDRTIRDRFVEEGYGEFVPQLDALAAMGTDMTWERIELLILGPRQQQPDKTEKREEHDDANE